MATKIVFDADWFVVNGQKYVKQLAFSVVGESLYTVYTFNLPLWIKNHRSCLERQARFSHKLDWKSVGQYEQDDLLNVFNEILLRVGKPLSYVNFYAKGAEKCGLLEKFIGPVQNLEDFGCPKYGEILLLPQTTLHKAIAFALWLDSER
jgi:hypothetical protein